MGIKSAINSLVGGLSYYNNITEHKARLDPVCNLGAGRGNQKYYDFNNMLFEAHSHENYMRMLDG